MSSLWSEALARKTKSAALDFPKVRTGKILHIYSQEHETLPGQISSFESSTSQTRFLNAPGPWSILGCLEQYWRGSTYIILSQTGAVSHLLYFASLFFRTAEQECVPKAGMFSSLLLSFFFYYFIFSFKQ